MEYIEHAFLIITTVVAAASMIVKGIAKITKITPSTKDDAVVSSVERKILAAQKLLDKVAINTHSKDGK
ncbi:MAG: hypothetical protein IBX50_04090 [Marinospirillum sp.]|uniref:hypothetical protein n=1 Tax=Marinospirillum sp. TaxID=2183934 RepID=UPI0019E34B68|nr:hypothetical protein [Marinospirillum sp.]MBE0505886.1 hypothetical protein [Marinospirillum sp.]